ncbi:MAG TPA: serine/threonine protein kinase, partial [Micromonosporaceae bacterium]|nr:serine/threonine protein kinase [Micromonosporaceae bacterium]
VVLLTGVIVLATGGDEEPPPRPPVAQGAAPQQPEIDVQRYAGRGLSVNVPSGWKKSGGGVYIDYTDPDDGDRRVRLLVEKASASTQPLKFLNAAGDRLDRTPRSCVAPYRQIGLREVEQAGLPSAELEYTCGEGDAMSHALWRAVVADGRAYSFRLTAPEARFEESKAIFDEMVRSFRLDAA